MQAAPRETEYFSIMKTKLIIKTPKPRNPHAVAARQRGAGAHGAYQQNRRIRRSEKQALQTWINRPQRDESDDK
jgi:hypothetical protein